MKRPVRLSEREQAIRTRDAAESVPVMTALVSAYNALSNRVLLNELVRTRSPDRYPVYLSDRATAQLLREVLPIARKEMGLLDLSRARVLPV